MSSGQLSMDDPTKNLRIEQCCRRWTKMTTPTESREPHIERNRVRSCQDLKCTKEHSKISNECQAIRGLAYIEQS